MVDQYSQSFVLDVNLRAYRQFVTFLRGALEPIRSCKTVENNHPEPKNPPKI